MKTRMTKTAQKKKKTTTFPVTATLSKQGNNEQKANRSECFVRHCFRALGMGQTKNLQVQQKAEDIPGPNSNTGAAVTEAEPAAVTAAPQP